MGQSRAEVLTEFLLEMNPWHYDPQTKEWDGVKGKGLVKDPSTITREDLQPKMEWLKELNP